MRKVSVELDEKLMLSLEETAVQIGVSSQELIADAVSRYVYYYGSCQWVLQKALESLEDGDVAVMPDVHALFSRWGVENTPVQGAVWSGLALRAWGKELGRLGAVSQEKAHEAALKVAACLADTHARSRAFPGQLAGTLEIYIEDCPYSVAFRDAGAVMQILGILPV